VSVLKFTFTFLPNKNCPTVVSEVVEVLITDGAVPPPIATKPMDRPRNRPITSMGRAPGAIPTPISAVPSTIVM
jgi:hypothetical protein